MPTGKWMTCLVAFLAAVVLRLHLVVLVSTRTGTCCYSRPWRTVYPFAGLDYGTEWNGRCFCCSDFLLWLWLWWYVVSFFCQSRQWNKRVAVLFCRVLLAMTSMFVRVVGCGCGAVVLWCWCRLRRLRPSLDFLD
jgi:hypothetical protein